MTDPANSESPLGDEVKMSERELEIHRVLSVEDTELAGLLFFSTCCGLFPCACWSLSRPTLLESASVKTPTSWRAYSQHWTVPMQPRCGGTLNTGFNTILDTGVKA